MTMIKKMLIISSLCVALSSCDSMQPDNTARNERDRNETLTPGDQSENELDRTITQEIRKMIMDDENLSMNAKNVKIITVDGIVTLRGPVNSDEEKMSIDQKAKSAAGVKSVDNQIEIVQVEES